MSVSKSSSGAYKLRNLVAVFYRRVSVEKVSFEPRRAASLVSKFGYGDSGYHNGLRLFSVNSGIGPKSDTIKDEKEKIQPSSQVLPSPSKPGFWTWTKWILGSVLLPFVLPFWTNKWVNLLMIKGEVETVLEEVENAAEVVEKAAVSVEKVAAEVADKLPENSRLKEAALLLEHASSVTAKDAEFTEDLIHKVENLEHDLNDLETIVEPIIDRIVPKDHQRK